jgi:hypothetical protein
MPTPVTKTLQLTTTPSLDHQLRLTASFMVSVMAVQTRYTLN